MIPGVRALSRRAASRASPALFAALALVGLVAAAASWFANRSLVSFELRTTSTQSLQVFHDRDGQFVEARSLRLRAGGDAPGVGFRLPDSQLGQLRFDPDPGTAVRICALAVDGVPVAPRFTASNDATAVLAADGCLLIAPRSGGLDPWLALDTGRATTASPTRERLLSVGARAGAGLAALSLLLLAWRLGARGGGWVARASSAFDIATARAHWIALVALVVFGSVFAHLLPPNGVPDEVAHLSKVAKVEAGVLLGDSGQRPVVRVLELYGPFHDIIHGGPFTPEQLQAQQDQPLACARAPQQMPRAADHYAPHLYAVPAVAMSVACATDMSSGLYLVLARILNLLLAAALVAVGIRAAGHGKWALFAVALLPMTVVQLASVSADSLTLALSFCFIGLVSGLLSGTLSPRRVRFLLPVVAVALAFSKPGAAWILVAIAFCGPAYAREGSRFGTALATVLVLPWILHVGWSLGSASGGRPLEGVDPAVNLARLTGDPLGAAQVLLSTFVGTSGEFLFRSAVGLLGWLDIPLGDRAYPLAAAMLAAAIFVNPPAVPLRPWVRIVAFAAAAGSLLILALPLYIYWTYADAPSVMGLQGRYYLPTIAFALVFAAMRAPVLVRAGLLAFILCAIPVLLFDARDAVSAHYYAGAL